MKVFVFDLLAYDANLDHLKNGEPELPYPLAGRYFGRADPRRITPAAGAVAVHAEYRQMVTIG